NNQKKNKNTTIYRLNNVNEKGGYYKIEDGICFEQHEFDIAIEIGKYRYLPGLDGCGTLHLYTTDGEFIKSGENYCYNWIKKYTDNK
ncbi:MAG: hypothetical protein J6A30_00255, partial [Ruminococcus sp.]|nr:hypothetical protein [Ruminococcus sp.]